MIFIVFNFIFLPQPIQGIWSYVIYAPRTPLFTIKNIRQKQNTKAAGIAKSTPNVFLT